MNFCAVTADLNRYLADEERREYLWESCADERNELETVQARLAEIENMTDEQYTEAVEAEQADLYDRERDLEKRIEYVMSGERNDD